MAAARAFLCFIHMLPIIACVLKRSQAALMKKSCLNHTCDAIVPHVNHADIASTYHIHR